MNALRLYAALGSSFNPAASASSPVSFFSASKGLFGSTIHKTASAPKATSSVHKVVAEAKELLSRERVPLQVIIHKHTEHKTQRHADISRISRLKVVGLSPVSFATGDILQSLSEKQNSIQSDD